MEVMPTVADLPKTTTVWPDPAARRARLNAEVARLLDVLDRHDHEHADIDQVWLIGSTVDADADVRSTSDIDLVVVSGQPSPPSIAACRCAVSSLRPNHSICLSTHRQSSAERSGSSSMSGGTGGASVE